MINLPRDSGIDPQNKFPDRFRELKLSKAPRMVGMLPEILFQDKSMVCSIFNALMFAWRLPPSELRDKSKDRRFSRLHKVDGIDEDNKLKSNSMICKKLTFSMQLGIDPDSLLFHKAHFPQVSKEANLVRNAFLKLVTIKTFSPYSFP